MRVALVVPYSLDTPGGVATHVMGLAAWLENRGHHPHVFAPGTRQPAHGVPTTLVGPATPVPFNGSVARLALSPGQAARVLHEVADFDVVHVHEPLTPGLAFAVARGARAPLVVTHHAAFRIGPLTSHLLRRRAASLPPRVSIAVSESAASVVRASTDLPLRIIPNAIDLPVAPGPRAGSRPRVVFVGRATERRKGFDVFARASAMLPDVDFIAVGPGRTRASGVTMLGPVSDAALGNVLASADALLAPNRFGESFGMVLVEALGAGAAVIASDLPSFRAVVDDPRLASFFTVGEAREAAGLVRRRLAQPIDRRLAWQTAGRFGWGTVGPSVEAAYREAGLLTGSASMT